MPKWIQYTWAFIRKQFHFLKGSVDNDPDGASSKKLTGFYFIVVLTSPCVYVWLRWAGKHNDFSLLIPVLGILTGCGLGALGINSLEKTRLAKIKKEEKKDELNADNPQ